MNQLFHPLIFPLLALIALLASCTPEQAISQSRYPENVGDIAFDPAQDDSSFTLCHPQYVPQYYAFESEYPLKDGKKALLTWFRDQYKPVPGINGFLTIRFVVNCEGKTGRFRLQEMSTQLAAIDIPDEVTAPLLSLTQQLQGWTPFSRNGTPYDHYRYLTFKLVDGNIQEILP